MTTTSAPVLACGGNFAGHHWLVTTVHSPYESVYHHACLRCGATKDVNTRQSWQIQSSSAWRPGNRKGKA